jgi:hypothetical protein
LWAGTGSWPKLHSLHDGDAREQTILTIDARPQNNAFSLVLRETPGLWHYKLWWLGGRISIEFDFKPVPPRSDEFTVDMLDGGCWFALNSVDRRRVVDVQYGEARAGAELLAYPWNGGDNQKWRAQLMEPANMVPKSDRTG